MKKKLVVLVSGIFLCAMFVGAAFAQPAGKAIVDKACSKCHGLKKVEKANKNLSQWETTLDRMIKKGAQVSPQEKEVVLKYLNTLNK